MLTLARGSGTSNWKDYLPQLPALSWSCPESQPTICLVRKDLFHLEFRRQLSKFLQLFLGAMNLERGIFVSNYKVLGDIILSPNTQWGYPE